MAKNIAFFADGTWNEPCNDTNVIRLFNATANLENQQLPYYDSGVGAGVDPICSLLGGAFGYGIFSKIKQGYSTIAAQYAPGDNIYIFGFSRGAYTARSLAGMIAVCGLPTINRDDPKCLDMAFEAYRNESLRTPILETLNEEYAMDDAKIKLLGVWDTVGSLGIPAIFGGVDVIQCGFLDTGLHPDVLTAVHALAIDERRLQFPPTLWTSEPAQGQVLVQAWFCGVHCDVGGGYPPDQGGFALSNITLNFMASYARSCGLIFKDGAFPETSQLDDALATLHDSLTGLYRLTPHNRNIVSGSCLYTSVPERCNTATANFNPENLHIRAGQLVGDYSILPYA